MMVSDFEMALSFTRSKQEIVRSCGLCCLLPALPKWNVMKNTVQNGKDVSKFGGCGQRRRACLAPNPRNLWSHIGLSLFFASDDDNDMMEQTEDVERRRNPY